MSPFSFCLLLLTTSARATAASNKKPNIFFILVDDLGFGDVNFNRQVHDDEIVTPNMDRLALIEGLHLQRHYVHFTCTPTRSSFQSGRLPVHVQLTLANPDEPNAGIPRNMTGIAEKLKGGGYETHMVGKWDCGMATFEHTPRGRGYDSALIYFEHKNDYWTQRQMQSGCLETAPSIVDLWKNGEPATNLNGTMYEEHLFANTVYGLIEQFDTNSPFFMVYAPQLRSIFLLCFFFLFLFFVFPFVASPTVRCKFRRTRWIDSILATMRIYAKRKLLTFIPDMTTAKSFSAAPFITQWCLFWMRLSEIFRIC